MDTFNLKDAVDQSLRLLEQSGVSAKTVKEYRTTGFGAIIVISLAKEFLT